MRTSSTARVDPVQIGILAAADLITIVVGIATLRDTPPSVAFLGRHSDAYPIVWAALLIVGPLVNLAAATWRRRPVEVYGSMCVAAGYGMWAVAALAQPTLTPIAVAVAGSFVLIALLSILRARQAARHGQT